mmetsp:Transcript_19606/g.41104  ORF Transcript_19606/g.41104 Transcript_19606/m.41104 type:complete len:95 (-) Transcript_19606:667-951(-)
MWLWFSFIFCPRRVLSEFRSLVPTSSILDDAGISSMDCSDDVAFPLPLKLHTYHHVIFLIVVLVRFFSFFHCHRVLCSFGPMSWNRDFGTLPTS